METELEVAHKCGFCATVKIQHQKALNCMENIGVVILCLFKEIQAKKCRTHTGTHWQISFCAHFRIIFSAFYMANGQTMI